MLDIVKCVICVTAISAHIELLFCTFQTYMIFKQSRRATSKIVLHATSSKDKAQIYNRNILYYFNESHFMIINARN